VTKPKTRLRMLRRALVEGGGATALAEPPKPESPAEALFFEGLILCYREQDFSASLDCFRRARENFDGFLEQAECLLEEAQIRTLLGQSTEAAEALRLAARTFPAERADLSGEASFHLARLLASSGDFQGALAAHKDSKAYYESRDDLGLPEYHGFETWVMEQLGDFDGWSKAVRALVKADPDKLALHRIPPSNERTLRRCDAIAAGLDALLRDQARSDRGWLLGLKAMALYIARKSEQALRLLEPLVAGEGADPFLEHLTGKCLLRSQQPELALKKFQRCLEARGEYFDLCLDLAMVHEILGHFSEAIDYYERLEELDPSQVLPTARAAILNDNLNRKPEAAAAYERMTERDPKNQTALVRLALLNASLQRDQVAQQWLDRALQAIGPDPSLLVIRGQVLYRLNAPAKAMKDFRRALSLLDPLIANEGGGVTVPSPGAADAPAPAGAPEAAAGTIPEARNSAVRLRAQAQLGLARIHSEKGRHEESAELVEAVLVDAPDNDEALLLRGDCARAIGSHREAVDSYKSVIDRILSESLLKDGLALYLAGRYSEALQKYRDAYARFPKNWRVFYNAALAYSQLGEMNNAINYLRIAQKINSEVRELVATEPQWSALRSSDHYAEYRNDA